MQVSFSGRLSQASSLTIAALMSGVLILSSRFLLKWSALGTRQQLLEFLAPNKTVICSAELQIEFYKRGVHLDRVPDDCPQNIADLIRACTSEDPGARPSAAAIFTTLSEHPAPPTRSSLEGTDWKTGDEQAV